MSVQRAPQVVNTFCENVTEARAKILKILLAEGHAPVAVRLGCSVGQISAIAHGKRNPGLRLACAIKAAYEIPVEIWISPDT